jgi:hypothetical protein
MQRARACHRKYGDACPHLERHSKKWVSPAGTVPLPRDEARAAVDTERQHHG